MPSKACVPHVSFDEHLDIYLDMKLYSFHSIPLLQEYAVEVLQERQLLLERSLKLLMCLGLQF